MKLAIYTTATTGYTHALEAQARKIIACLSANNHSPADVLLIVVTDIAEAVEDAVRTYRGGLPTATVECLADTRFGTGFKNYEQDSQLLIAQMRTAACTRAIAWGADYCLSLDGDVLPPHNAIRCMLDMLTFDNGYYGVSFCPYPSHGGGPFLGGRGTPQNPILPDFYEDEKDIPAELIAERDELRKEFAKHELRLREIEKIIRELPPNGSIFEMNAKRWRRRGWFDNAYPALGKGAIVPVDWTGCGCTMMNREALALCDWTGYDGRGTEDLFLNFKRWYPAGINIACIPHCPCDHVIRHPQKKGLYVHIMTGHADDEEHIGHLRQWPVPWHAHQAGERHCEENDGSLYRAPVPAAAPLPPLKTLNRKRVHPITPKKPNS
jgi:hypothetical protein